MKARTMEIYTTNDRKVKFIVYQNGQITIETTEPREVVSFDGPDCHRIRAFLEEDT